MLVLCAVLSIVAFVDAIIGGFQANPFEIRSQVSLFSRFADVADEHTVVCGGVLIAPNVVLTAAHCVFKQNSFSTVVKVTTRDFNIFKMDDEERRFLSHAIVLHPNYKKNMDANDDVALVFLPEEASVCTSMLSAEVARLPPHADIPSDYQQEISDEELESALCYTAGWGRTESGNYSHVPMQMLVKISVRRRLSETMLLAKGVLADSHVCMGDSGSPVYCYLRGRRHLAGVLTEIGSFGPQKANMDVDDQMSLCRDFEYAIVADIRSNLGALAAVLKYYKQDGQLTKGQAKCYS